MARAAANPSNSAARPAPAYVIFGDEEFQKSKSLQEALDALLPPTVDRGMALCEYDGTRAEDQGGPALASVFDDLMTLPFLSDRRVVVIRDADGFISAHREPLERYIDAPSKTGVLVLVCRTFPKTTRLYKQIAAAGGRVVECKKPNARGLVEFVSGEAVARGKRLEPAAAARIVEQVGDDLGSLANEVEKLALFVGARSQITLADVQALVGMSREEKIFAVMDAAGSGDLVQALAQWRHVLDSDNAAEFKAVGGVAFMLRKWHAAQRMAAAGGAVRDIAPKVMMWGRERELEIILKRQKAPRVRAAWAALAELDAQAKSGARSIEAGVESLLIRVAETPE